MMKNNRKRLEDENKKVKANTSAHYHTFSWGLFHRCLSLYSVSMLVGCPSVIKQLHKWICFCKTSAHTIAMFNRVLGIVIISPARSGLHKAIKVLSVPIIPTRISAHLNTCRFLISFIISVSKFQHTHLPFPHLRGDSILGNSWGIAFPCSINTCGGDTLASTH